MNLEKIIKFGVLCYLILAINASAIAKPVLEVLRGNGSYPPYEMVDKSGRLIGVHIEIVKAVGRKLGFQVVFKSLPWNRAIHLIKKGEADAITYIGKTKTREQFVYFCPGNNLSETRNAFFALKEQAKEIDFKGDFENLAGLKVGTIQGYSYGEAFNNATSFTKDSGAQDQQTLVKKLLGKRFDLAFGNLDTINYALMKAGLNQKIVNLPYVSRGLKQYIAFSKHRGHKQLADEFAEEMIAFKKTASYLAILKKYGLNQS